MKYPPPLLPALLLILCMMLVGSASAQVNGEEVDDLTVRNLPGSRVQLDWKSVENAPCEYSVSYTVYRSSDENFSAEDNNRVRDGVRANTVVLVDRHATSFYRVYAIRTTTPCAPNSAPRFKGVIEINPIGGDKGELIMSLRTKWRLDEKQRGFLSYLVRGIYFGKDDAITYMTRTNKCSFSLQLLDAQEFKIREIPIDFLAITTTEGRVVAIEANNISLLPNSGDYIVDTGDERA